MLPVFSYPVTAQNQHKHTQTETGGEMCEVPAQQSWIPCPAWPVVSRPHLRPLRSIRFVLLLHRPNPPPFRLDCPWPGDELAPRSTGGDATYPAAGERGEVPAAHVPNGKAQAVAQPDPVPGLQATGGRCEAEAHCRLPGGSGFTAPRPRPAFYLGRGRRPQPRRIFAYGPPASRLAPAGGRRPGEQVQAPGGRARRGRAGSPVPYARGLEPWGLLRRVPQGLQPYDCAAASRTRGRLSRAGVGKGLGARNHPALPLRRPPQPRLVTRSRLHSYRSLVWWKPAESIGRVKPLQHVTAYKILKALQLPGAIFWSKETL
ncbi:translation initiation factor IF-2-like [Trachypithecus francoisi]|uniref:translation initiation factor IF-2-like n=1 Tax=Trachypithecus francoisi TaxID=54180 RepID=UPI00141AB565|nr:translation initiation factor IF-2-like [Trachypithecus francoisi]